MSVRHLNTALRVLLAPPLVTCVGAACVGLSGRWRPLAVQCGHPSALAAGCALGVPLFLASLVGVGGAPPRPSALWQAAVAPLRRPVAARDAARLGVRALFEEALWRATLPFCFGGGAVGVVASAALFTLRHLYLCKANRRPCGARRVAELFAFSLLLGVTYHEVGEILLVAGAHWVRNVWLRAQAPPSA